MATEKMAATVGLW